MIIRKHVLVLNLLLVAFSCGVLGVVWLGMQESSYQSADELRAVAEAETEARSNAQARFARVMHVRDAEVSDRRVQQESRSANARSLKHQFYAQYERESSTITEYDEELLKIGRRERVRTCAKQECGFSKHCMERSCHVAKYGSECD